MKIVCISDTHGEEIPKLPDGDMLIHAGDFCTYGEQSDFLNALADFRELKKQYEHIIVIPGNHCKICEKKPTYTANAFKEAGITYLCNSGVEIEGIKFWGSPTTPKFYDWAFMKKRGSDIQEVWDMIPEGTDVLITHGPPFGILDQNKQKYHCGCENLLSTILKIKPKYHIFGHIHDGHGQQEGTLGTQHINCSLLNDYYRVKHKPIEITVE